MGNRRALGQGKIGPLLNNAAVDAYARAYALGIRGITVARAYASDGKNEQFWRKFSTAPR
jgi:hypothetical protein